MSEHFGQEKVLLREIHSESAFESLRHRKTQGHRGKEQCRDK